MHSARHSHAFSVVESTCTELHFSRFPSRPRYTIPSPSSCSSAHCLTRSQVPSSIPQLIITNRIYNAPTPSPSYFSSSARSLRARLIPPSSLQWFPNSKARKQLQQLIVLLWFQLPTTTIQTSSASPHLLIFHNNAVSIASSPEVGISPPSSSHIRSIRGLAFAIKMTLIGSYAVHLSALPSPHLCIKSCQSPHFEALGTLYESYHPPVHSSPISHTHSS